MKFYSEKRVALFGTSADPPTIGHEKIIEELSKNYSLIIIYASDNPKKNHRENIFFRSLLLKTLITDLNRSNIIFDQNLLYRPTSNITSIEIAIIHTMNSRLNNNAFQLN